MMSRWFGCGDGGGVVTTRDSAWWCERGRSVLDLSFCNFWVRRKKSPEKFSGGGDRGRPVAAGYNGREGRE
ncbi:hypothetical protein Tco_0675192, partial [Tanacetum coccineum]